MDDETTSAYELTPSQRAMYKRLQTRGDIEAIHGLLVRHGPTILDFGLPYIVVAARNWRRSEIRKAHTMREAPDSVPQQAAPSSIWDPWVHVQANDELRRLALAMADLDDTDALVLWRHVEGRTDREIAQEWDRLGYEPAHPTVSFVAKRRQRARERLRRGIA